ncbi:Iron-regulated ABC transporter permease protein SufD [Jatrophihabitans sp. GAS493]|uniref:Fe-S cluster assembly protein SufD n=1 Tax=Jatrophihabitans sp. GAS493 TaxID=1907575 RepID=UPI000BB6E0D0|nr:Fe-S cluster assembly protein SufD [Jatrophihabitans sp. GAS493]SOD73988.1 Iron-regulated ABC transporter permease protein SufD [Jatrophihabitans sp. GAS493]
MSATDTAVAATTGPQLVGSHSHGGMTGSPPERFTSRNADDFAVPTGREEEWRFTPIRVVREFFNPITASTAIEATVVADPAVRHGAEPMSDPRVGRALQPADRVSALAFNHSAQAFVVVVPASTEVDEPVVIDARTPAGTTYAHLVVEVGAFARATVVVNYSGAGSIAENVELIVGDGAKLSFISVHNNDASAVHLAAHSALLGRDSTLSHSVISLGGRVVRVAPTVRYTAPGGSAELRGLAFAGSGQHHEARLYIDHSTPDCVSNVLYKNALQGASARTVWIGDVRIRPAATGTETFELNRNLVLTDGARADSVPNLEIETGEITGAGHASATGRFDDLQLFYLQARGIPEAEARRLVVRGFFADIVDRLGVDELQESLMSSIEDRLGLGGTSGTQQ